MSLSYKRILAVIGLTSLKLNLLHHQTLMAMRRWKLATERKTSHIIATDCNLVCHDLYPLTGQMSKNVLTLSLQWGLCQIVQQFDS